LLNKRGEVFFLLFNWRKMPKRGKSHWEKIRKTHLVTLSIKNKNKGASGRLEKDPTNI